MSIEQPQISEHYLAAFNTLYPVVTDTIYDNERKCFVPNEVDPNVYEDVLTGLLADDVQPPLTDYLRGAIDEHLSLDNTNKARTIKAARTLLAKAVRHALEGESSRTERS
jgi:signal recognition particle GTPase